MKSVLSFRPLFVIVLLFVLGALAFAQSKPQKPTTTVPGNQKKNQRPTAKTEEEQKKEDEVLSIKTNIVSVDAVVYDKKSGQILTGLKKENFAIFENGVKQDIAQF